MPNKKFLKNIKLVAFTFLLLVLSILSFNQTSTSARTMFLPAENIAYSPARNEAKLYKEEDLVVSIVNFSDAKNGDRCKFLFAQYGREAQGIIYEKESEYRDNRCQQTLKAEEQIHQGWSISIQITTEAGIFRNDSNYLFKSGPVGVVTLGVK